MRINGWSEAFETGGVQSITSFTHKQKKEMAGNMMTSGVLAAIFTAIVATAPLAIAIQKVTGDDDFDEEVVAEDEGAEEDAEEDFAIDSLDGSTEEDAEEESKAVDAPVDLHALDDKEDFRIGFFDEAELSDF